MTGARLSAPSGVSEGRAPSSFWPVGLTVGVLVVSNVVSNRLLPGWAYVPWNAAVAVLLIVLARRVDHLLRIDIGIANVRHGLKIGAVLMAAVLAVYLVSWAIPATHGLFKDRRVGERTAAAMLYEVFIRIPFGTVLLEEVAFRGVLLGQLGSRLHWRMGLLVTSLLFGLWHVLPAWAINTVNPVLRSSDVSRPVAILGAVAGTAVAGLFMGWVRIRARSLLAPVMLHIATNSFGFAIAWLVVSRGG
jgi:uncharacterized protein